MRKVLLVLLLFLLGSSYALPSESAAAVKTVMYVNAKSDIILRTKPTQNSDRLGTIKNHGQVTMLSSSNGWSYIQAGKSKGYVYTSALSKKNPKIKPAPTTVTKGLTPVDGLILTYSPSLGEDAKEVFHVKKQAEFTYLYNKKTSYYSEYTYIEDKTGIMFGVSDSDVILMDVLYPLTQGTYAKEAYPYTKVLVESTTKTIKTKAGSFRNVVILRNDNGYRIYLAKGIGIIKITNSKGKTVTELAAVKNSK